MRDVRSECTVARDDVGVGPGSVGSLVRTGISTSGAACGLHGHGVLGVGGGGGGRHCLGWCWI